ncbi:hypothetical protein H0A70_07810 [Alcaligenaceae bacterium]|nr:hypothetical protein [Alcaligenaceae bacterium]
MKDKTTELPRIEVPYLHCNPQRADILTLCNWCEDVAKRAIEADRKHRGEPVAWYTEDHLTDKSATTYDPVVADRWRAKGWPVHCLYAAPQPAEPTIRNPPTVAEPVKVLSDAEDDIVDLLSEYADHNGEHGLMSFDKWMLRAAVRALLARYGQPTPPADGQPAKEPL